MSHRQFLSLGTGCCLLISLPYLSPAHAAAPVNLPLSVQAPQVSPDVNVDNISPLPGLYLQAQFGVVSESDFGPALAFYYEQPEQHTNVTSLSAGRHVGNNLFGWPADGGSHQASRKSTSATAIFTDQKYSDCSAAKAGGQLHGNRYGTGAGITVLIRLSCIQIVLSATRQTL